MTAGQYTHYLHDWANRSCHYVLAERQTLKCPKFTKSLNSCTAAADEGCASFDSWIRFCFLYLSKIRLYYVFLILLSTVCVCVWQCVLYACDSLSLSFCLYVCVSHSSQYFCPPLIFFLLSVLSGFLMLYWEVRWLEINRGSHTHKHFKLLSRWISFIHILHTETAPSWLSITTAMDRLQQRS